MIDTPPALGTSLVRTIVSRQLGSVVFDWAEVALDSVLKEGVVKDIPFIGSIVKLVEASQAIREENNLRQLLRFLVELKSIPNEERARLLGRFADGSVEQQRLGENLLLAIERLDCVEKPAILARFFIAYVKEQIDDVTFSRLTKALDRFNVSLTPNLVYFYSRESPAADISEEIVHELSLAGLVTASLEDSGSINGSAFYKRCHVGMQFVEIAFDVNAPD